MRIRREVPFVSWRPCAKSDSACRALNRSRPYSPVSIPLTFASFPASVVPIGWRYLVGPAQVVVRFQRCHWRAYSALSVHKRAIGRGGYVDGCLRSGAFFGVGPRSPGGGAPAEWS